MAATLTDSGILAQTAAEIFAEMGAAVRVSAEDPALDISTDSPFGRLYWPIAERLAALQVLTSETLYAFDPQTASGVTLEVVNSLRGTERLAATASTVTLRCIGTPTTDLSGRLISYEPDGSLWQLPDTLTIGALGYVDAVATATELGVSTALQAGPWVQVSALAGFTGVQALSDPESGRAVETEPDNRERLERARSSVVGTGPGSYQAIYLVPGIDASTVTILRNRTDVTDAYTGNPPHSLELVCEGGNDLVLGETLYRAASDIATFVGTTEVTFTLSEDGRARTCKFTRPTDARVYAQITLNTIGATVSLPSNAEATMRAALVEWSQTLSVGEVGTAAAAEAYLWARLPTGSVSDVTIALSLDNAVFGTFADPGPRAFARISDSPSPAVLTGTGIAPFNTGGAWQLDLDVDGSGTQSVVPGALAGVSADTLATALPFTDLTTSASAATQIVFTTDSVGTSATIEVLGTSTAALLTEIGLTGGTTTGLESDIVLYTVV